MKKFLLKILLGSFLVGACEAQEIQDYLIGSIDPESAKFHKIYTAVADADFARRKAAQKTYRCEILQNIGDGEYRIAYGDEVYILRIPGGKLIADGTQLELPLLLTDEVFQYTTVLGAVATQTVVIVAPKIERITIEKFIIAMRQGQSFDIELRTGERGCPRCFGHGRLGGGVGKASSTCQACSGSGKQGIFTAYRILW